MFPYTLTQVAHYLFSEKASLTLFSKVLNWVEGAGSLHSPLSRLPSGRLIWGRHSFYQRVISREIWLLRAIRAPHFQQLGRKPPVLKGESRDTSELHYTSNASRWKIWTVLCLLCSLKICKPMLKHVNSKTMCHFRHIYMQ